LDADIEKGFDRIEHHALVPKLHTLPAVSRTLTAWLTAGVLDGEELFPTATGVPQGGVLSPLLLNGALHGRETAITTAFPASQEGHRWRPRGIRFAADLVVFHRDAQASGQAQDLAARWLQEMGLTLKPSKTRSGHTLHPVAGTAGVEFLGFQVRPYPVGHTKTGKPGQGLPRGFPTLSKPAKGGQRKPLRQLHREGRQQRAASQKGLIYRLHPLIRGGSNS